MSLANKPIYPDYQEEGTPGMTLRECYALGIMESLLRRENFLHDAEEAARLAVRRTDALIAALEKP